MIEKTLIKITILVLIFSLFLEISYKNILNYLIFLGIVYLSAAFYLLYKMSVKVDLNDDFLYIRNFFRSRQIKYKNIDEIFTNSGFLQRRFGLMSIYIITRSGNYLIKDIPDSERIFKEIEEKIRESKPQE
ncbi:PH domain-containing protein [Picrophilus oshimae DSM 9789]|uniref:PH domain-containing protein n=2 Tax=Picrophilus oshimae TaxID=46632 RepID=A0A8G2L8K3_PICTO|nr:PH domain-containing protein [Picrophilus oshimae DSM 9789]